MTGATGKGNCMSAKTKSFNNLSLLILLGGFVCAPYLQAQQQDEEQGDNRHIERLGEASTDEWDMDLALPDAAPVVTSENGVISLPDEQQNQQLQQLLSKMAANPGNDKTLSQLNALLTDVLQQANDMMVPGSFEQAGQILLLIKTIEPEFPGLKAANQRIKVLSDANDLLVSGYAALDAHKYTGSDKNNALFYFKQTLRKDPSNEPAKLGIGKVQQALVETAMESAHDLDFDLAEEWLLEASQVQEDQQLVENARSQMNGLQQDRAGELEVAAIEAMNSGEFTLADFNIFDLIALGGQEVRIDSLRSRLKEARVYGGFEPGQIINDNFLKSKNKAPTIIFIAAGSFLMGSEKGAYDNDRPRHRVTIEQGKCNVNI
jgi:hypothetical protein